MTALTKEMLMKAAENLRAKPLYPTGFLLPGWVLNEIWKTDTYINKKKYWVDHNYKQISED